MNKDKDKTDTKEKIQEKPKSSKKSSYSKKKKAKKNILNGIAYVQSTFNNTIVSIADTNGNVISWASSGQKGFKGSRKSTPYAAQVAADAAAVADLANFPILPESPPIVLAALFMSSCKPLRFFNSVASNSNHCSNFRSSSIICLIACPEGFVNWFAAEPIVKFPPFAVKWILSPFILVAKSLANWS